MKKAFVLVTTLLLSANSFAAVVKSAQLDASKKNIVLEVTYSGGCGPHEFSLALQGCAETFPVQCQAQLIEKTEDFCEALVATSVVISLAEASLTDSYYQNGSLSITGDKDWETGNPSRVNVRLP
jgi:hypothetical protein